MSAAELHVAKSQWDDFPEAPITPLSGGLINATWAVGEPPFAVLQRLHPIFSAEVNEDIEVVTRWLAERGMPTPRLIHTRSKQHSFTCSKGHCWRALTFVPGHAHGRVHGPRHALEAGRLVARWHRCVDDLQHDFRFTRAGVHDTTTHMERLRLALAEHSGHRLYDQTAQLAEEIFTAWAVWDGLLDAPVRLAHGDLKISNLLFDTQGQGLCLVDLDTMGWLPLDVELGDAWRSWCNRTGEDATDVHFDLEIFAASAQGYQSERPLGVEALQPLPAGVERIAIELSARFAADAVNECYFGWDPQRASGRGEHNLLRARGQLALSRSVRSQRGAMEKALSGPSRR